MILGDLIPLSVMMMNYLFQVVVHPGRDRNARCKIPSEFRFL
jgi:hypothetical protein